MLSIFTRRSANYSAEFFTKRVDGAQSSARVIVPLVMSVVGPKTAIDVGCGTGIWAAELLSRSVDATGIDGAYVDRSLLQIPVERFEAVDLIDPPEDFGLFDLAICLEVAEHLPERSAEPLVTFLTDLSDNVLFGAAIPGQGGVGHVNEQPQSYWIKLFSEQGYHCHDVIRPAVWMDPEVSPWYAQNSFLFTRDERPDLPGKVLATDLVHPGVFRRKHKDKAFRTV